MPRPRGHWKRIFASLPVATPQIVMPLTFNPRLLDNVRKATGCRFRWCKRPDGWWIWRIE